MRARERRIRGDRLLEESYRLPERRRPAPSEVMPALQEQVVRGKVVRSTRRVCQREPSRFRRVVSRAGERRIQRRDDRVCELVLYLKHILHFALVRVAPTREPCGRVHELRRDAQTAALSPHTSLEHVAHVQRLAHVLRANGLIAERERRASRGHLESGHSRERGGQLVRHSIGEVFRRGVLPDVRKRKHGDERGAISPLELMPTIAPMSASPLPRFAIVAIAPITSTAATVATAHAGTRRFSFAGVNGSIEPLVVVIDSSVASTASAVCGRSAGHFSSSCFTSAASAGGVAARLVSTGVADLPRMRSEHRLCAAASERRRASEHLVRHRAECIEIRAAVHRRISRRLFGRHVCRRAECDAQRCARRRAGHRGRGERFRDSEIRHECVLASEEDVLRLNVAMHHPMLVCVRESAGDVAKHAHDVGQRKLAHAGQPCAQRLAVDERHGVVGETVGLPGGQQRHDVRVLQPSRHGDLPPKALDGDGVRELRGEHLHHDRTPERLLDGDEDARHASAAELALERVIGAERGLELLPELLGFHLPCSQEVPHR